MLLGSAASLPRLAFAADPSPAADAASDPFAADAYSATSDTGSADAYNAASDTGSADAYSAASDTGSADAYSATPDTGSADEFGAAADTSTAAGSVTTVPAAPDVDAGGSAAAPKITFQNDLLYYDNRVTGSSPSSSFLTVGRHTQDAFGVLFDAKPSTIAWEGDLEGNLTDDPRVDAKRVDLKKIYLKGDTDKVDAVVGDLFATFSDYSLGMSLKGGMYTRQLTANSQVIAVAGTDKANWDDLWNHNRGETVDRQVYGLRAQHTFLEDGSIGASFVDTKDERSRFDTSDVAITEHLFSVDWTLPRYHKLALSGESAYSLTDNDQPTTDANGAPTSALSTDSGWAHKVRAQYSYGRFKTINDFERVSPLFQTTVGSASPDLVTGKTANTWTISGPWKWVVLNYTYFHNNLTKQQGVNIATTRMVESGLRYEAPDWRPNFALETKVRHREVTSTDTGLRERTRSVISSIADRFGPESVEVDYEFQNADKSDGSSSMRHHILGISSNGMFKLKTWQLAHSLRYDLQRDRDNLLASTDQNAAVHMNVVLTSPWGADGGVSYSRTLVLNAKSPGNDQRTWQASLGYNILKHEDQRIEIRFRQNDNRFQTPSQDYKEMIWETELKNKF